MDYEGMVGMMLSCVFTKIISHYKYQSLEDKEIYENNVSMVMLMVKNGYLTIEELQTELERFYNPHECKEVAIETFCTDVQKSLSKYKKHLEKGAS